MRFDIGTAITTGYSAEGWLGVNVDPFGGSEGGGVAYPVIGGYGFAGRPSQPANDIGAQTLYAQQGHDGFAWIGHDPRDIAKLPQLTEGSSVQYNARGAFNLLDYDTETATLYVPLAGGTKAHCLQIGYDTPSPGETPKRTISIIHSDGFALTMTEDSLVLKNAAGDAYIEINSGGIVLNGNCRVVGGIASGPVGGQPLTNNTLLAAWWAAVASAVSATGPTPITGVALGALMAAQAATIPGLGTTTVTGL